MAAVWWLLFQQHHLCLQDHQHKDGWVAWIFLLLEFSMGCGRSKHDPVAYCRKRTYISILNKKRASWNCLRVGTQSVVTSTCCFNVIKIISQMSTKCFFLKISKLYIRHKLIPVNLKHKIWTQILKIDLCWDEKDGSNREELAVQTQRPDFGSSTSRLKKKMCMVPCLCNPEHRWVSPAHWPTRLTKSVRSSFSEIYCLKR